MFFSVPFFCVRLLFSFNHQKQHTMKEFMLIFRNAPSEMVQSTPEAIQTNMKLWMDWIGDIAAQNKLVSKGSRLFPEGKVMRPAHVVTDGPYMEIKEVIGGFSVVRAGSLDEATEMAKGCPILQKGGTVEIREVNNM
jgi:hypothetical protein